MYNVAPDSHTFVAVLKACGKLGDVKTAFDVLQEMKVYGFPMTEHVYNELIRAYAGACLVPAIPEAHIDMYIKDAHELFKTLERDEDGKGLQVNIEVLNSMVYLYTTALRPE